MSPLHLLRRRSTSSSPALIYAALLFVAVRLLVTLWGATVVTLIPAPLEPDPVLRPYLDQPALTEGAAGLLLGPWQRFDALRYLSLAREGYTAENSVFPPLYPLAIRAMGSVVGAFSGMAPGAANLLAALLLSSLALFGALALLYRLAAAELGAGAARRAPVYLLLFPAGFFLLAPYSESFFLLFAIGAVAAARADRPLLAGSLGFLAALSRLTGWILVAPLAWEYLRRRDLSWRGLDRHAAAALLPGLGLLLFLLWRQAAGFPPLDVVYSRFWHQTTALPGADVGRALGVLLTGAGPRAGEWTLLLDLATVGFLAGTTLLVFRHLGATYGLYNLLLLFFMLLPTSDLKPLYSFARYALAFFPSFMLLGAAGQNPWVNRLILYPSIALYLYFSGQFFIWGWVA